MPFRSHVALAALALSLACNGVRAADGPGIAWPEPGGRATIRRPFGGSTIAVGVSARTAGAIDSLTWGGTQFVNAFDHGRELQSAVTFDGYGECLNPTEAGSDKDGAGPRSTSLLTVLETGTDWLRTRTRMAYFMGPGAHYGGCPKGAGPYTSPLSDDVLTKHVTLGAAGIGNAIAYRATFTAPRAHSTATYEVVTGYMPPDFARFWTYDPAQQTLAPLSKGPGEQGLPVILATADGTRAMGVYAPDLPQAKTPEAGYGRFSFTEMEGPGNATVKWNCVLRKTAPAAGDHSFTCYVLVGTLRDVRNGMDGLRAALRPAGPEDGREPGTTARQKPGTGMALFVGTQAGCNAGEVTIDPDYKGCPTTAIGSTLDRRHGPGDVAVFAGTVAGEVTNNSRHLDAATRPVGFLAPAGSGGTALHVGIEGGCNAGMVTTNPAHLNCRTVPLGEALPSGGASP